jgi:hypothetical protein
VETVVVLRCEAEDDKSAPRKAFYLVLVRVSKQPRDSELASLDPQSCRLADCLERHQSTIRPTHESVWVVGQLDGPSLGLKFSANPVRAVSVRWRGTERTGKRID